MGGRRPPLVGLQFAGDLDSASRAPGRRRAGPPRSAGAAIDSNGPRLRWRPLRIATAAARGASARAVRGHGTSTSRLRRPAGPRSRPPPPTDRAARAIVEQVMRSRAAANHGRIETTSNRSPVPASRPRRGPRSTPRAPEAVRQRPTPRRSAESGDRARQARLSGRVPTGWVGACIVPECPTAERRVTGQLRARLRRSARLSTRPGPGSSRVRPRSRLSAVPRQRPDRQGSARPASTDCGRADRGDAPRCDYPRNTPALARRLRGIRWSGSANELGCDQLAQLLMARPRPNDCSEAQPFDYRRESRRAEIESTIRALASPDRKWSSRNAWRATGSGGHGSRSSAPSSSAASWTGRATLAWI